MMSAITIRTRELSGTSALSRSPSPRLAQSKVKAQNTAEERDAAQLPALAELTEERTHSTHAST